MYENKIQISKQLEGPKWPHKTTQLRKRARHANVGGHWSIHFPTVTVLRPSAYNSVLKDIPAPASHFGQQLGPSLSCLPRLWLIIFYRQDKDLTFPVSWPLCSLGLKLLSPPATVCDWALKKTEKVMDSKSPVS